MPTIFLYPTSPAEIADVISTLKNNCACGADEISTKPIKSVAQVICHPLSHICNLVLSTGEFPVLMKIARVVALHKGVR